MAYLLLVDLISSSPALRPRMSWLAERGARLRPWWCGGARRPASLHRQLRQRGGDRGELFEREVRSRLVRLQPGYVVGDHHG